MKKVYVIGHRNPDTDSICSAIAYANLKNQVEGNGYEAYRAGNINGETRYVLDTFGIKDPKYVSDVRPRLKDVNLNLVKGAKATDSLKSAREMMQTEKIVSLPVLDGKKMIGLVSISDVLKADMDVYDNEILAKAKTPYKNVVETLDGTLQAGNIEGYITEGKLTVSAASVDTMEEFVTAKDTVIVANREDAQIGAIQTGVQCVVVCMGTEVTDKVLELAKEKNCRIITTPYDTFTASRLICQAMPVSYIMATDTIVSFNETDFVDDVKEEMTKKRFRYFPVLNADNEFVGFCHMYAKACLSSEHERTDVKRAARAVRRHPSGIRADGFEHGLNELFLRIARHFQTGGRVVHAFGVHIWTEGDDLALLCRISLQTFETALGIMEDAGRLQQRDVLVSDELAAFPSAVFPLILITVVRRGIGKSELCPVDVLFFHFGFIRRVNTLRRPSVGRPPTLGRRKKSFCLTSLLQVRRPFEACQKSYHPSSGRLTRLLGLFH